MQPSCTILFPSAERNLLAPINGGAGPLWSLRSLYGVLRKLLAHALCLMIRDQSWYFCVVVQNTTVPNVIKGLPH